MPVPEKDLDQGRSEVGSNTSSSQNTQPLEAAAAQTSACDCTITITLAIGGFLL